MHHQRVSLLPQLYSQKKEDKMNRRMFLSHHQVSSHHFCSTWTSLFRFPPDKQKKRWSSLHEVHLQTDTDYERKGKRESLVLKTQLRCITVLIHRHAFFWQKCLQKTGDERRRTIFSPFPILESLLDSNLSSAVYHSSQLTILFLLLLLFFFS